MAVVVRRSGICALAILLTFVVLTVAGPPLQVQEQWTTISRKLGLGSSPKSNLFNVEPRFRLPPDTVKTKQYDLTISPILEKDIGEWKAWTAPGIIKITFTALQPLPTITLNKDESRVTVTETDSKPTITVTKVGGADEVPVQSTVYDANGLWVINLGAALEENVDYELTVGFVTTIPTVFEGTWSKTGLYGAKFKDASGQDVWMATTQFETTGFRKMAPAFDEPHHKAIFNIRIGRPADPYKSLSNSEILSGGNDDPTLPTGYVRDDYKPTEKMSTYLIALLVSNYVQKEANADIWPIAEGGKPVSVYGPPHLMVDIENGGEFSADTSARILKYYSETFAIPYAMHKMDSVAIPRDYFEFGAMENWGLNTYRDNILLLYTNETAKSTENTRASITSVLAHELAHQWFGNYVTTIWWSNIWLNEGFATYVSYLGVAAVEPLYDPVSQCIYDAVQPALSVDAGPSSHPIINTATETEVETMTIFDTITYEKGASLIRMMEAFLTKETLMNGLKAYLDAKKFDNAHQDDLFSALQTAANDAGKQLDIKGIMDTYTLQRGFPLVRVSVSSPTKIYISQERYRNNVHQAKDLDPDELWEVPVTIVTQADRNFTRTEPEFWINKNVAVLSRNVANTTQWIIVNPGGYGYYRVLYDTPLTNLIQTQLNDDPTIIDHLTRSKLIDDYFRFAEQGYVQWPTALGMANGLGKNPKDTDHTFWIPVLSTFANWLPFLDAATEQALRNFFLPKVEDELDYLGWSQAVGEHGVKVQLRASLLDWACSLDSQKCIDDSTELFKQWAATATPNPIPVDLQSVVYCTAVANTTENAEENFNVVWAQYRELKVNPLAAEHATRLVNALTCTESSVHVQEILTGLQQEDKFSKEHLNTVIKNLGANPQTRNHIVGYVHTLEHWQSLVAYTATDDAKIETNVISAAVSAFAVYQNTEEDVTRLQALMADIQTNNKPHYDKISDSLNSSLNRIRANMAWITANRGPIKSWLEAQNPNP